MFSKNAPEDFDVLGSFLQEELSPRQEVHEANVIPHRKGPWQEKLPFVIDYRRIFKGKRGRCVVLLC